MSFKLGKTELLQILQDWNFWGKELPLGVLRTSYLSRMKSLLTTDQVMVVQVQEGRGNLT